MNLLVVLVALNIALPWQSGAQWYAASTALQQQLDAAGIRAEYRVWPHALECADATQYNRAGQRACAERVREVAGDEALYLAVSRGDLLGMFWPAPHDARGSGVVHHGGVAFCNAWGLPSETYRTCVHEVGHGIGFADWAGGAMSMEGEWLPPLLHMP